MSTLDALRALRDWSPGPGEEFWTSRVENLAPALLDYAIDLAEAAEALRLAYEPHGISIAKLAVRDALCAPVEGLIWLKGLES